jgi:hypothetical protein
LVNPACRAPANVKLVLIWNNTWLHLDYANKELKPLKVGVGVNG